MLVVVVREEVEHRRQDRSVVVGHRREGGHGGVRRGVREVGVELGEGDCREGLENGRVRD